MHIFTSAERYEFAKKNQGCDVATLEAAQVVAKLRNVLFQKTGSNKHYTGSAILSMLGWDVAERDMFMPNDVEWEESLPWAELVFTAGTIIAEFADKYAGRHPYLTGPKFVSDEHWPELDRRLHEACDPLLETATANYTP